MFCSWAEQAAHSDAAAADCAACCCSSLVLGLRVRVANDAPKEGARLVALNPGLGVNCALLVDRLAGLRHAADLTALEVEEIARPGFAGARWRDANGREWQEIKLSALAADGQFIAIAG